MAFEVSPLPYDYDALEPRIDEQTMQFHHDKHHQAYVDKANAALADTDWAHESVEHVLSIIETFPEDKQAHPQQRGRPREPQPLLGDHEPGRRRRAGRRPGRCDQRRLRLAR